MATHDYNIANQIGSEFRADLNNALLAIVSNNSNATSPSTTYAYQLWVDTANNVLKLRNSANNAWITTGISITASNSFTGDITGNSATATALATARTINGVSFDGTANISFNTDSVAEGSSNKYFTNERVDDQVNSLLTAGSGISLTYDDAAGTLTIANTNSADITSVVAGDGLTGGGTSGDVTIAVGVDDSSIEINSDALRVKASGITNAMLGGSIANSKLANSSVTINSQAIALGGSHTFDSDDIGEGSSNLYFTNARARGSLSIGSEGSASGNGAIAYNSSTGVFTYTPPVISGLTGDTDDLSEGSSNLYYTDARANSAIDARVTNTFINNLSGVVADTATALATARSIALSGDVTASGVNFDGTGDITLSTTIAANSVALGTDTTGNYVATVAGTTNEIEVSGSGSETAAVTIGLPDNVTIAGNLTVNGTTTTVNTATLEVEDPLIKLAKANSGADSVDIGFYGLYDTSGSQDLYAGLFRDASDSGKFKLFKDLQAEPTTTVNTSGTGYAVGTLVSNLEGNVTGNVTGNVSGTAATVTGAAQTNITSLGTLTGLTTTGNINLGDDDKVIFGAGSDLQIYHDGSNSFINDAGDGNLNLDTNSASINLTFNNGAENMITASANGAVVLYHDNAFKLATDTNGVNVSGLLDVSSKIAVAGGTEATSSDGSIRTEGGISAAKKIIGGTSITAGSFIEAGSSSFLRFIAGSSTTPSILFGDSSGTGGTLSFKRNSDSAVAMSIDATGTVTATTLAGTLSTAAQPNITSVGTLTSFRSTGIDDNADALAITIDSSGNAIFTKSGGAYLQLKDASAVRGAINVETSDGLVFTTGSSFTERMRIDSSGNVGVGTTSPSSVLHVVGGSATIPTLSNSHPFTISNNGNSGMSIISSGTTNAAQVVFGDADDADIGRLRYDHSDNSMRFFTNVSERMRLDSSGNLLIGVTSAQDPSSSTTAGHTFYGGSVGVAIHSRASANALAIQRTGSDGAAVNFFKTNSVVGSISLTSSATAYNTSSDARLKNITGSARGLDVINNLNPVAYNWKADNHADEGLIAQEVEELVPNAVNKDEDGFYSMDYSKLVTHLVKGMQEQQEQIESLKSEIANLKEK